MHKINLILRVLLVPALVIAALNLYLLFTRIENYRPLPQVK